MSCSSSYYEQFAHLKIPLEKIISATNNFSDANSTRSDMFGNEYKGQLLRSCQLVDIVARRLDETRGLGEEQFWTEVSMLSRLEHENIVLIIGFCDENGEKIIITKDESTRGDLYDHLGDPTTLTWMRRLQICVDVGHALSYIHYDEGRDFSVIHRDICSHRILLDDKWEARLSGFELSMTQAAAERHAPCQLDVVFGTQGYIDPTYQETGSVSHKSDIFSLGVVLFELLCGKGTTVLVKEDDMYLYQSAISHYREGRLYNFLHPVLVTQIDTQSLKIFSDAAYECLNDQPSKRPNIDQVVIDLEKALKSQREYENFKEKIEGTASKSLKIAHLKIPVEEIVSATNNFSEANLIRRHGFGKEYRGQLSRSDHLVDIVARRFLDDGSRGRSNEFFMEVSMLSKLKHKNIVSMVGFCDAEGERIVINKHETIGSLDKYLRDPTLTWIRRLEICVGVAHALNCIYYDKGRDFSIIHRDIKSSKILLDEQWEAKLSGFELSITHTASRRDRLCLTEVCGTKEYRDPTYVESGSVTHKSDIYAFGIVLFEVLCGKEATMVSASAVEDISLSASFARSHYQGGRLENMIDPVLWKQMNTKSFEIFSETAYCCLKEQRAQRPNIDQVIIKLKQALLAQREHDNPFTSKARSMVKDMTSKTLKGKDLTQLEIPLIDIQSATKNFAKTGMIGSGTYGEVYKAELDHFDHKNLFPLEEKYTGKHSKKRSTVAIKRILSREDKQGIKWVPSRN